MLLKNKIPVAYIFNKIKYESVFILAYSFIIWELYDNAHITGISIPLSVPAILGTVLSLLLGFRSNQAYDRWWEARHIWGAIVNDSRSLARQAISFMQHDFKNAEMEALKNRMIKRQIAWAYSLGQALRHQGQTKGLERFVSREELLQLSGYTNTPAGLLMMHGKDIQIALNEGFLNRFQQVELDHTISRLCDAQGKCERIKNTVFPSTYGLYIHFSLILFIALLPFGLIQIFDIMLIPVVTAISICFILIEKMAIHLQDPFDNKPTDTPVTTISMAIERDLTQMMLDGKQAIEVAANGKAMAAESSPFFVM